MTLSRRDFVRLCSGTVAGYGISRIFHPAVRQTLAETLTGERPHVFWLQGQGCTGCSVSLLNSAHPAIAELLLRIISLDFHPTLMAGEGEPAISLMHRLAGEQRGRFFLVVEGAVPVRENGRFCVIGEDRHRELTLEGVLRDMAPQAAAVLAMGSCAAYGGVSAARGSVTGAMGMRAFLHSAEIQTPVVNIPGCPPHPDWMTGTLLVALDAVGRHGPAEGVAEVMRLLDAEGRPTLFYGANTHQNCPYLYLFDEGRMAGVITDKSGCRYDLGCKGPGAMCDSPARRWNGAVNWCVENALCTGCVQPDFPDGQSPFYER
ncbi:MAG: hydrogenase small subunit [Desulfovibrionaceae bacterium]|nr:hydrogenase small subunit [Desulfovibrionaceae bacterium]